MSSGSFTARKVSDDPPSYRIWFDDGSGELEIGSISERRRHTGYQDVFWTWGVDIMPLMDHGGSPRNAWSREGALQASVRRSFHGLTTTRTIGRATAITSRPATGEKDWHFLQAMPCLFLTASEAVLPTLLFMSSELFFQCPVCSAISRGGPLEQRPILNTDPSAMRMRCERCFRESQIPLHQMMLYDIATERVLYLAVDNQR